ncbi:PDZ domain-containing protein MAGIX isoform X2 [Peromyscus eremicus]|uniref:PDZ domain-containing protein MAGIX isoform X2 n=1 Tax=Peromyscus eremicus TaxID=42410 RepID=UPI0027DCDE04|nr:PDZ domain-containing protein MAGIX isoform X2 [Peromyscus eremicus]
MDSRAGNTADPRGSRGGGGLPGSGGSRARQLLERLDARPLAARAAADLSALARKAGATLRLRHKEAVSVLDSADIEVTDSRLPHATLVEHRSQPGDLVLHINGESTQGLTHAQVVERIRTGGPRLCLVLRRPQEMDARRIEEGGGHQKKGESPDPRGSRMTKSRSTISPVHHPPKARTSLEPSPEAVAVGHVVPAVEHPTEDLDDRIPGTPGPWLVPSEDRLSQALGVRGGGAQLAQEMAAGRRRH